MSTLYDRLLEESRRDIKRGEKKAQIKIVKNMLNKKIDDKIILEMTEIQKVELEKIKSKWQIEKS